MRPTTYGLTLAAIALAGTLAGVRLGLAAAPLLQRWIMRQATPPIDWEGID